MAKEEILRDNLIIPIPYSDGVKVKTYDIDGAMYTSPILEERTKKRFLSAKKKLLFGDKYGNKDKGEI